MKFKPLKRRRRTKRGTIYGISLRSVPSQARHFFKEKYSKFFIKNDRIFYFLVENKDSVNSHRSRFLTYDQEDKKIVTHWEMDKKLNTYKWNCAICNTPIRIRVDIVRAANINNFCCDACKNKKMPISEKRRLVMETSKNAIKHFKKYHEKIIKNLLK